MFYIPLTLYMLKGLRWSLVFLAARVEDVKVVEEEESMGFIDAKTARKQLIREYDGIRKVSRINAIVLIRAAARGSNLVGLATARELVEQIVDPINEELERLQLKPVEKRNDLSMTNYVEIAYGKHYTKKLEKIAGEKVNWDTPLVGQDVYLTPYWKAYLLKDRKVLLITHKTMSDIIRVLPDKDSFRRWREWHYNGFPDPETGRRQKRTTGEPFNEFLELPIKEDTAGEKAETLTPEEMRQIYLALRVELSPQDADRILSKIETIQKEVERK
jgi:hypothetical protein